jgi:RNA polymerase sigma-70 factor, ECF subfamily
VGARREPLRGGRANAAFRTGLRRGKILGVVPVADIHALMVAEIPRLRRYARFLVRDAELADDLVQDTLTRAVARLDSWQPGSNMRAWLFVILHNGYVSYWRRLRRRPAEVELVPGDPALAVLGRQQDRLDLLDLKQAFAQLGPEHQQILLMVGVEGLRYEDAAAALNLPVGTVRSRLFRARMALRQLLDGADERAAESGA